MDMEWSLFLAILAVLICLFLTVFALLVYSGLLTEIDVKAGKPPFGEISVAYKFARGPYRNAGELFTEVHSLVHRYQCVGLYYDDPQQVAPSDLRYAVGVIVNGKSSEEEKEDEAKLLENGYKLITFPAITNAVNATFPFKNTVSIFLAVARVYPRISEYIKERKLCAHPMMEVYDDKMIYFVAPLSRQEDFYVPESKDTYSDEGSPDGSPTEEEVEFVSREQIELEEEKQDDGGQKSGEEDGGERGKGTNGSSSAEESNGSSFEELNLDAEH